MPSKEAMDQGAPLKQPSNTILFATAVACAAAILWAYSDQPQRTESQNQVEESFPADIFPEPSLTQQPALTLAPTVPAETWSPAKGGFAQAPATPDAADRAFVTAAAPRRLPAPQPPDPTPTRAEPPVANDSTEDLWAYDPYYEPLCDTPTPAEPIAPEHLWTEEKSVLASDDQPFVYSDEDAGYVASLPPEELLTYTPLAAEISQQVTKDVQAAFSLGRHGALHAARQRFIQVMRQIATAKDVAAETNRYTESLDAGLTALAEARDYLPGGAVSKDLTVEEVAVSHLT
ncbi:MAG: hypothetical protein KDA37_15890, partial [Planctomycetales bacterium]|nr:hypothetical protein [Planctomycetales bacterium]